MLGNRNISHERKSVLEEIAIEILTELIEKGCTPEEIEHVADGIRFLKDRAAEMQPLRKESLLSAIEKIKNEI